MIEKPELYFPRDVEWREWLEVNNSTYSQGVYLIFYKLENNIPTMRWEEAVRVALCFGWIDSTIQGLGGGKRRQYFCPRNPKAHWSALNKRHVVELAEAGLIHDSGWKLIEIAKETGTWNAMDHIEDLVIPEDLQAAFRKNPIALKNFQNFSRSYQKGYLYWLFQAKRSVTREKRIVTIIDFCKENIKSRQ